MVPGPPGSERLAILQAGETVTPAGRRPGGVVELRVTGSGGLYEAINNGLRTGQIQLELA